MATPGTNISLRTVISLDDVMDSSSESDSALNIDISLRDCISGESLINNECYLCERGTYSLDPTSDSCSDCPDGAKCYGNNTMVPKSGYWRSSNETDVFFECLLTAACLGGEVDDAGFAETGKCEKGYEGNKC